MKVRVGMTIFFVLTFVLTNAQNQKKSTNLPKINFEIDDNTTSTYAEIVDFYRTIDKKSPYLQVQDFGITDAGLPLQEVVIASDRDFSPLMNKKKGKTILFINNGIHPGEPDGIDASMLFVKEIIQNPMLVAFLKNVTIVLVPVYNVDGCLNRGSYNRVNQNGPQACGFRANDKNLDLNRDFIKCDTKNAATFHRLFHKWDPDLQIDTHTSNGADYQYTMTMIATQKDKLSPPLGDFLTQKMLPVLFHEMEKVGWEMSPYVFTRGLPETGIYGFMDGPRYSSGYAALHHTVSFMPETHMLKPYKDRVLSTLAFLKICLEMTSSNGKVLQAARKEAKKNIQNQTIFNLKYDLDQTVVDSILFKGYTAEYHKSEVSGLDRLFYNKSRPYQKKIPYFNTYKASLTVEKPKAYLIPQAYDRIVHLLETNGVQTKRLRKDTIIDLEMYKITQFKTSKTAYEGHFNHSDVEVIPIKKRKTIRKGDVLVFVDQIANRFIVETLEPQGVDSYFCWNFFDGILAQKEYFSDYVFEDLAADLLKKDADLRQRLQKKQSEDVEFAKDAKAQLDFVYKNSPYYESTHMLYPVARILK